MTHSLRNGWKIRSLAANVSILFDREAVLAHISLVVDWTIYGEVAKATVRILNGLMASVATLLTLESSGSLPEFDSSAIDYSE